MQLHISPQDGVPIYLQIVNQIKFLVASGRLKSGEELPSIRALAEQVLVNPNTVARAYRELAAAGVVVKRRTAGTFVADAQSPLALRERRRLLNERLDALLVEGRQLGFSADEIVNMLGDRQRAFQSALEET